MPDGGGGEYGCTQLKYSNKSIFMLSMVYNDSDEEKKNILWITYMNPYSQLSMIGGKSVVSLVI